MSAQIINLDSRRKVPSILQQMQTIKDEVIQDVIHTYAHLPWPWVEIACRKAAEAIDKEAGKTEALRIAGNYLSATMEANKDLHALKALIYGDSWTSTITK